MKLPILSRLALATLILTTTMNAAETKKAVLAAGCFWCVEAIYERVPGVTDVISGYAGGHTENPTYESSNTGRTGHAEAVEITYDPDKVTFAELLDFFSRASTPPKAAASPPTSAPNTAQSRSTPTMPRSRRSPTRSPRSSRTTTNPIAVEVTELEKFWKAEDYHQDYEEKHAENPYIRNVSVPRMKRAGIE